MSRSISRRRKPMADINVVPYIDVMLVLLVIFMVTAPMFNQGVQVSLPQAPSDPIEEFMEQDEPFIVSVDKQSKIYVNKGSNPERPMSLDEFRQLAPGMLAQEPTKQAYVKGDQNVAYGRVVEVMVALQQAGVPSVGLISQPENER
jgi:biopolymer transport protein TolR